MIPQEIRTAADCAVPSAAPLQSSARVCDCGQLGPFKGRAKLGKCWALSCRPISHFGRVYGRFHFQTSVAQFSLHVDNLFIPS